MRIKLFSIVISTWIVLAFPVSPGWADDRAYTVRDIAVDAAANNGIDARQEAFLQGQKRAFDILYRRLSMDTLIPPVIDDATLNSLVNGFDVQKEKMSSTRYVGSLTYYFSPEAVKNFLRTRNVHFSDAKSQTLLILPILLGGTTDPLWEERSPWRQAWEQKALQSSLVPLLVPQGDTEDIAAISSQQAIAGDTASLRAIAQRYGVSSVLVVTHKADSPDRPLQAEGKLYMDGGLPSTLSSQVKSAGKADDDLSLLAQSILRQLENRWKQSAAQSLPSEDNSMVVFVPISRVDDLFTAQQALKKIPAIRQFQLSSLRPSGALFTLVYQGGSSNLRASLRQYEWALIDLSSERGSDQSAEFLWELRPLHRPLGSESPS